MMNTPLLVRSYDTGSPSRSTVARQPRARRILPPVASFTFAEILRSADSPDFQSAIDGIAEICAKNRMSLADEYASHLPPQGEITAASSLSSRPAHRPAMRRPLTSVPEASSSGSEGSERSKKRRGSLFFFRPQRADAVRPSQSMRIGSMGRNASITSTTAMSTGGLLDPEALRTRHAAESSERRSRPLVAAGSSERSQAVASLQNILHQCHIIPDG